MVAPRAEKAYEKYAWLALLIAGLLAFPAAFFALSEGINLGSLSDLVFAVLTTYLSVTGYRRGRKWAWFALLYTPPFYLLAAYDEAMRGNPWQPPAFFALLCVVGLVLPYRKFFPKKQPVRP